MSEATETTTISDLLDDGEGIPEADTPTGLADDAPAARAAHPFADLPLDDDGMPSADALRNALRAVIDPEIGYNIVDLGLVYEVTKPQRGSVHVLMTLTSIGCPLSEIIHQQCSVIMGAMPGVDVVNVEFTFTPPWSTEKIADYVREELRAMGMNV
ncbi:MAG: metal-sulfur cluster assembly factor [Actinomycetota bacterium]|jgi:metal-sulfur cluster biosynthetic enzyme|nr:metal-sulfur cluster assembly factor [Actinomycetota bacterium]MDA3023506.1 metal-sulfur cluster assembly factor [Actinomycetota bacterium]